MNKLPPLPRTKIGQYDPELMRWLDTVSQQTSSAFATAQFAFVSRAAALDWIATTAIADGTVFFIGDLEFRKETGATAISDMPDWLPAGDVSPGHFAENTDPGVTDMTAAVSAAYAYVNGRGVIDGRSEVFALYDPVSLASITGVIIRACCFSAIGTWVAEAAMFDITRSSSLFVYLTFENCEFQGNAVGNGIKVVNANGVRILNCWGKGFPLFAVKTATKAGALLIDGCNFKQYEYGDAGFDVEAGRTAKMFDIATADFILSNNVASCCYCPLYLSGSFFNGQVTQNHFFNGDLASSSGADLAVYVAANNINFVGNYFDNGCVKIDADAAASGVMLSDNWFTRSSSGSNTYAIQITSSAASALAGFRIVNNQYSFPNVDFLNFSGTFAAALKWVTYGNLSNAAGVPTGLPLMNIGQRLTYDDTGLTMAQFATDSLSVRSERSIRIEADYSNDSNSIQSRVEFATDGTLKAYMDYQGKWTLGVGLASGGGDLALLGYSGNKWNIQPSNAAGTATDSNTRLEFDPATGFWATYGGLKVVSTTYGLGLPPVTTVQRDAMTPANGWLVYNSTAGAIQGRQAGAWANLVPLAGTATISVPAAALEVEQTFTATGVTAASRILVSLQCGADADENTADMLDLNAIGAKPGTDQITVCMSFREMTSGPVLINWSAM